MSYIANITQHLTSAVPQEPSPLQLSAQTNIKNASKEFASYVVSHLIKEFVPEYSDSLLGTTNSEKFFREFLLNEYSKEIAKKTDFGIAKSVEKTLARIQELQNNHMEHSYDYQS